MRAGLAARDATVDWRPFLVEHGLDPAVPDNRIIGAAIGQSELGPTTMVSNDAALRIKAAHLGVPAAEHRLTRSDRTQPEIGWSSIPKSFQSTRNTRFDRPRPQAEFLVS